MSDYEKIQKLGLKGAILNRIREDLGMNSTITFYPVKSNTVCPACGGKRWQVDKNGLKVRCLFCGGSGLGYKLGVCFVAVVVWIIIMAMLFAFARIW